MSLVEVRGPKGPSRYGGTDLLTWARNQLEIASQIIDNPGGGLLFATQTMGQVRAAFDEAGDDRRQPLITLLERAEDAAVRREFEQAQGLLGEALAQLSNAEAASGSG